MDKSMFLLIIALLSFTVTTFADTNECSALFEDVSKKDIDREYFKQWSELFNESERLEATNAGKLYKAPMLNAHNSFFQNFSKNCLAEAKSTGRPMFMAISVVSKTGVIEQYLTYPRKKEYQCFVNMVVGEYYPIPPADHYPIGFMVFIDDPGKYNNEDCLKGLYDYLYTPKSTPNKSLNQIGANNAPPG